jgi:hypothetical protein
MSCCGKKRKVLDPNRPTLASPIAVLRPSAAKALRPRPPAGDAGRDGRVTDGR